MAGAIETEDERAADPRLKLIRELCEIEPRYAGTDAERRAAKLLAERLRESGRKAEIEPTYVHPEWARTQAVHCFLAIAASVASLEVPEAAFALVLAVAISAYGDLNTRWYLIRRLFFRRASQNVFSRGRDRDAPARVVLIAHYDAARSGRVFSPRAKRLAAAVPRSLRIVLGPLRIVFWSIAALLPFLGARMAGVDEQILSNAQLIPTVLLLIATAALLNIWLSDVVPGANDNASGVAVALAAADELERSDLEQLEVCVLLTGAEECLMEGMREFIRSHRDELDRPSTYFIAIDTVGRGQLYYATAEGLAVTYRHDRRLAELCALISEPAGEGDEPAATPIAHPFGTDALPATLAGYPAIAIHALDRGGIPTPEYHTTADLPELIEPEELERARAFVITLVRALDRDLARGR